MKSDEQNTDFGYQQVPKAEKAAKVASVFTSVANKYDLMNDLMSFGIHRLWKRLTIASSGARPGQRVLDLAAGTADLSAAFADKVGKQGLVVVSDINPAMLSHGRDKLINAGHVSNVDYTLANAEQLPFPDNHFDIISIAFGLRNVTDKQAALAEMYRCLTPGGRALILEFSKPILPGLNTLYDLYSFNILPTLGAWVADDASSYQYLAESIRMHPDQETLLSMMEQAGFDQSTYQNISGGIVALHKGFKA